MYHQWWLNCIPSIEEIWNIWWPCKWKYLDILTCKLKIVNNKERIWMKLWYRNLLGNDERQKRRSNCGCRTWTLQSEETTPTAGVGPQPLQIWSKQKETSSTNRSNYRCRTSTLQSWTKQQAITDEPTNQRTSSNQWTDKQYMYLQWWPNCIPSIEEIWNIWWPCKWKYLNILTCKVKIVNIKEWIRMKLWYQNLLSNDERHKRRSNCGCKTWTPQSKKNSSNCGCRTPNLQSWRKQKQETSTNRSNRRHRSSTLQSWTKKQQAATDELANKKHPPNQ